MALNFCHTKLHGKQISKTEVRKEQWSCLHIFSYFKTARPLQFANMQIFGSKNSSGGQGGSGGSPRDQAGLQTDRLQKLVLQKSDLGKTFLSIGCFVQKSTLPGPSRSQQVERFTFQEAFPIESASSGGMHTILGAPSFRGGTHWICRGLPIFR